MFLKYQYYFWKNPGGGAKRKDGGIKLRIIFMMCVNVPNYGYIEHWLLLYESNLWKVKHYKSFN